MHADAVGLGMGRSRGAHGVVLREDDLIPEVYANYQRYDFVEHIESRLIVVSTESTSSTGPGVACTDTLRHVVPDDWPRWLAWSSGSRK